MSEPLKKQILFCSASNFPDKISVYSTLVGLLNVKDYKCGEEVCYSVWHLGQC